MKTVSVIVPCYNEQENLPILNNRLQLVFRNQLQGEYNFRVVFINDGSTDESLLKMQELQKQFSNIDYISLSRNFGHQQAIKAGIDCVNADAIITMDADLQHPPELITELISGWEKGYDIVNTKRKDSDNQSFMKKFTSSLFYFLLNKLSYIKIEAGSADFRLLDCKVISQLRNLNEQNLFFRGVIPWMGFNQKIIEYCPDERKFGKTKYTVKKMISLAIAGITSFSIKPLRISIFAGLFLSIIALFYMLYALYIGFFTDKAIEGWTSVIVSVLFIGGLQLLMLGILGEYIGKIFIENKKRPHYIIDKMNIENESK